MSSTPKKSTEAEDVLEFLNSLPEADKKNVSKIKGETVGDGSDIMEFLDELEASSDTKVAKKAQTLKKQSVANEEKKTEQAPVAEAVAESVTPDENEDDLPDPIASISNWWSSSGSATVTSLWGSAQQFTQKAHEEATKLSQKAQEEATKLATQAKLDEQIKKLQNLQLDEETKKRILNAGDDMDPTRALDFFTKNITSVLSSFTSTDEVLKISVVHDLENYYVESIISKSFKKVMKQVQGGIGIELVTSTSKDHNKRNLNIFEGKAIDGEKLAHANLEGAIREAGSTKPEGDEVRSSNIYISILPIQPVAKDTDSDDTIIVDTTTSTSFHFLIILKDITNDITILTKSQAFPLKWATWLDGSIDTGAEGEEVQDEDVDPSEWVKDWVYDGLSLSFGVLAQSYVVKRMGYD